MHSPQSMHRPLNIRALPSRTLSAFVGQILMQLKQPAQAEGLISKE